jgi:hypothetical protein
MKLTESTTVKDYIHWLETADDEDGIIIETEKDQEIYSKIHQQLDRMNYKIKG